MAAGVVTVPALLGRPATVAVQLQATAANAGSGGLGPAAGAGGSSWVGKPRCFAKTQEEAVEADTTAESEALATAEPSPPGPTPTGQLAALSQSSTASGGLSARQGPELAGPQGSAPTDSLSGNSVQSEAPGWSQSQGSAEDQAFSASSSAAAGGGSGCAEGGSRFWKGVVRRLHAVYLEQRLHLLLDILAQLEAGHWQQLLEFAEGLHIFLAQAPACEVPAPPALPLELLTYILTAYAAAVCGSRWSGPPPVACSTLEPMWYLEAMLLFRLLLGSSTKPSSSKEGALGAPSRFVQFCLQLLSSSAAAAFLFTAGLLGHRTYQADLSKRAATDGLLSNHGNVSCCCVPADFFEVVGEAWACHGGDVFLACQHVLIRLYPGSAGDGVAMLQGPRAPLGPGEVPSFWALAGAVGCHFSVQLLLNNPTVDPGGTEDPLDAAPMAVLPPSCGGQRLLGRAGPEGREQDPGPMQQAASLRFSSVLRCLALLKQQAAPASLADRLLLCTRDVLQRFLGPAPARPDDLPPARPPLAATGLSEEPALAEPDVRILAQIVRSFLQACNARAPALAASEETWRSAPLGVEAPALVGCSGEGDFVPTQRGGPLRRGLEFMEQSALLQMVQSRLVAATFSDVQGSTGQLAFFAVRGMRVVWFDLRRCTSTLKRDLVQQEPTATGGAAVLLVLRNLRICLVHDWEARLATFPYLHLHGGSRVVVRNLVVSIRTAVSYAEGAAVRGVEVAPPELDIQLSCASALSQVVLSGILKLFQASLEDHIQKQLRKVLLQLLQQESSKWNSTVWRRIMSVAPKQLVTRALAWLDSHIPPEGVPI